jgi:hypothetical protein
VREYQEHATSELERSDELISRKGTALSQVCQSGSLSSCRDAEASLCLLSNRQYVCNLCDLDYYRGQTGHCQSCHDTLIPDSLRSDSVTGCLGI